MKRLLSIKELSTGDVKRIFLQAKKLRMAISRVLQEKRLPILFRAIAQGTCLPFTKPYWQSCIRKITSTEMRTHYSSTIWSCQ